MAGTLTLGNNAHLHMNVVGTLTAGLTWTPVKYALTRTGTLTFDSGALFTLSYIDTGLNPRIDVTSK